jgi:hypothetical protein
MRHVLLTLAVIIGCLELAPNAQAQVAVIDSANLVQNIQTAAQAIVAVEQLKAQLTEMENTYTMFTNPTNIMNMGTGMENQAIENPMPLANSVAGLVGGTSSGSSAATTFYTQDHVYTPTDGSPQSTMLNNNAESIANIEGMAQTNLSAIQTRLQELPNLESDIQAATSINQVTAINGRIQAESQFVQGQQAQAANLQVLATEQAQSEQQQQQEKFDEDQTNLTSELQSAAAANGGQ